MQDGDLPYHVDGVAWPKLEARSGKAILFDIDGVEVWVPKSAIHDNSELWEVGQPPGQLVVKQWFAEKRGWC